MYVVYQIKCNKTGLTYFGSTKNYAARIITHESRFNTSSSRFVIENGDYTCKILHKFASKKAALRKEQYYLENFENVNQYVAYSEIKRSTRYARERNSNRIRCPECNKTYIYDYAEKHKKKPIHLKNMKKALMAEIDKYLRHFN